MSMKLTMIVLIFLVNFCFAIKIADNGPNFARINFVIMGDGFTLDEQSKFDSLANLLKESLFSFTPYKQYQKFINIHRINLVSEESGTDIPSEGNYISTVLNSYRGTYGYGIREDIAEGIATDSIGSWDAVIIIINYHQDGGATRDKVCFFGIDDYSNTCRHEIGHAFANLADEYVGFTLDTNPPPYVVEPNVAVPPDTTPETIKWAKWVTGGVLWPTPNEGIYSWQVGLFDGARYTYGVYRPEFFCIMQTGGGAYCRICTEAIVLKIKDKVNTIDSPNPPSCNVGYTTEPLEFSLGLLDTENIHYIVRWYLDDSLLTDEQAHTITIVPTSFNFGTNNHTLKAIVKDSSTYWYHPGWDTVPFVKNDPRNLMQDTIVWPLIYGIAVEKATLAQAQPLFNVFSTGNAVGIRFNPQGTFRLSVHDIRGRLVDNMGSGFSRVTVQKQFRPLASGVYIVRLIAGSRVYSGKAVVLR